MSDTPDNQGAETEKGFGTGLRAQLQRRREGDDGTQADGQGPTNVELRFELTARPRRRQRRRLRGRRRRP